MRVDSHQHFWKIADGHCRWLTPDLAPIRRDFGPDDLRPILRRNNVAATVLVQAADCDAETDWMLDIAASAEFVAGIVGWTDFAAPDAPERLRRLAANPKIVGVRPMIQDIPDPDWMLRPDLAPACRAVAESGMVFDALVLPKHLDNLALFLARYPEMKTVVDHAAKPALRLGAQGTREWIPKIRRIAEFPETHCKFSGLLTEAAPGASVDDLRECAETLLDAFGENRLLWGSDWPVLNLAADYDRWLEMSDELLSAVSPEGRAKIMGENAARFYGLQTPPR